MKTLEQLSAKPATIPTATSWYLADLGEARGRQEMFTKQSPQRLKVLREHALIEQHKDRYYETLEHSSHRWHDGRHDPWPSINDLLFILKAATREFEERVGQLKSPRGAKTELVESIIAALDGTFTLADLERACPGVSGDMVRRVPRHLQQAGKAECLGRGPGAPWRRKGITPKRG